MTTQKSYSITVRNESNIEYVKQVVDLCMLENSITNRDEAITKMAEAYKENKQLKKDIERMKRSNGIVSIDSLGLTEEQIVEAEQFLNSNGYKIEDLLREALLDKLSKEKALQEKLAERRGESVDENSERIDTTVRGVAEKRIASAINQIMDYNDLQEDTANKICITGTLIFKATGSNRKAIDNYLEKHSKRIEEHNIKNGFEKQQTKDGERWTNQHGRRKTIDVKSIVKIDF